jgi:hypothetical protein
MRIRISVPEEHVEPSVINAALEAVTRLDHNMIASGDAPLFDPSNPGVKWRPEPMGDEHFDNAGTVEQRGWGDCDDLAPWRAASLRATGEDPGAVAIVVPSGPNMFHAIVRRSDGSNDDPSQDAGMQAKSVVGDGGALLSVWACDDAGTMYYGQLPPTTSPIMPHCGPTFAVRPIVDPDAGAGAKPTASNIVGYQARVDCPVVGSRVVRMRHRVRAGHHHHHRHHHHHHVHGVDTPYALSCTQGDYGLSPAEALAVACAGALQVGIASGTASPTDRYKLFVMHRLLAQHHPSDVTIELAQMMAEDHVQAQVAHHQARGVHGYIVGDMSDFLQTALGVVNDVAPLLDAIPGVGTVTSLAMPVVNMLAQVAKGGGGGSSGTPAPGSLPQPAALAAAQHAPSTPFHYRGAPPPAPGSGPRAKPAAPNLAKKPAASTAHAPLGPHWKPPPPGSPKGTPPTFVPGQGATTTTAKAMAPPGGTAQASTPGTGPSATAMSWDALQAMHQGGYSGSFGPFTVTF